VLFAGRTAVLPAFFACGTAPGAIAEAVIRSVELIVQPDAHDVVGEVVGPRNGKSPGGFNPAGAYKVNLLAEP
jgi:hypothetical protein